MLKLYDNHKQRLDTDISTHAALHPNSRNSIAKQSKLINILDTNNIDNFLSNCCILTTCEREIPDIDPILGLVLAIGPTPLPFALAAFVNFCITVISLVGLDLDFDAVIADTEGSHVCESSLLLPVDILFNGLGLENNSPFTYHNSK